jgi:hypothetical protein
MNIKELMEKASKGPFEVDRNDCHTGHVATCHGEEIGVYYEVWTRNWYKNKFTSQGANAQLIAHCLNNFPKLLEALDTIDRRIKAGSLDEWSIKALSDFTSDAIKEASEVQI